MPIDEVMGLMLGVPGTQGGGASALTALLDKFKNEPDSLCALRKGLSDAGSSYEIFVGYGNHALYFPLGGVLAFAPDAANPPEVGNYRLYRLVGGISSVDCTMVPAWTRATGSAFYDEGYNHTETTGAYIETTTPDGITEIGCHVVFTASAVALVTIDGDPTAANALPTAQELVSAERLADTVLVANGGTLNPTDRILDLTDATWVTTTQPFPLFTSSDSVVLASGLAPGAHTVRIAHTGYRPVGGTSDRIRLCGFWFDDPAARAENIPVALPVEITNNPLPSVESDNNFAFSYTPEGGTAEWMGHAGSQYTVSADIYVDDVLVTPILSTDRYKYGAKVELRVSGVCRHSEVVNDVAEYTQSFIWTAEGGVEINHDFTWLVAGTATGYMPQLAAPDNLSMGSLLEAEQDYDLSASDGASYGNIPASAAYMWEPGGKWAALCCVPAYESVPVGTVWLQDRSGGAMNKIYFERFLIASVSAGERIQLKAIYRFKEFEDADAALARPT